VADDQPSRIGRGLAILVVAGLVLMWLYVFTGAAAEDPPDQLDDTTFAEAAEPRCAEAVDDLEDLPAASEAESAADRAAVLDEANTVLTSMVDDLAAIEADNERDQQLVDLWIADWRTYLQDRRDYADLLRADDDAELLITAREGRQITLTIDRFASKVVNDMESCTTPLDA
jgi:hypothetical protein